MSLTNCDFGGDYVPPVADTNESKLINSLTRYYYDSRDRYFKYYDLEGVEKLVKELVVLKENLELTRGAMRAQDERECLAGQKCGVGAELHGCDWPDAVADQILQLKKDLEIARAERNTAVLEERKKWMTKS